MTAIKTARISWRAKSDGTAHAHRVGQGIPSVRTVCHQPWIREQDMWPTKRRCGACETGLEEMT